MQLYERNILSYRPFCQRAPILQLCATVISMPRRYHLGPCHRAFFYLITFLVAAPPLSAWWETGHRVVARIAAAHLTPAARTRIARILDVADTPEGVANGLATASTWADETKGQTHTGEWHYIDLALQDHKKDIGRRCPHDDCAPERIRLFATALRSRENTQRASDVESLRYIVHLVGDIHQPLHTATDGDQGGNCEVLTQPVQGAKNLHALWDGGIIDAMDMNQFTLASGLQDQILEMSQHQREKLDAGSIDDWAWESHELAITKIYQKLHIPTEPPIFPHGCTDAPSAITSFQPLTDGLYIDSMKPVIRLQLIKAGLRLAKLLNESM